MFDLRDLFQWERFITPSIIKIFYWLAVGISTLAGLSGMISGLTMMAVHPLVGIFYILASLIGVLIGVILPFTPLAPALGLVPLPGAYFVFLGGVTLTYLVLVEVVKRRLMRQLLGRGPATPTTTSVTPVS